MPGAQYFALLFTKVSYVEWPYRAAVHSTQPLARLRAEPRTHTVARSLLQRLEHFTWPVSFKGRSLESVLPQQGHSEIYEFACIALGRYHT